MGSLEKIKTEKLRETVIHGYDTDFKIVLTQTKQSHKGVSIYKVFIELKRYGELYDSFESYATHSREKSDRYFSGLESRYPEKRLTRKIF